MPQCDTQHTAKLLAQYTRSRKSWCMSALSAVFLQFIVMAGVTLISWFSILSTGMQLSNVYFAFVCLVWFPVSLDSAKWVMGKDLGEGTEKGESEWVFHFTEPTKREIMKYFQKSLCKAWEEKETPPRSFLLTTNYLTKKKLPQLWITQGLRKLGFAKYIGNAASK